MAAHEHEQLDERYDVVVVGGGPAGLSGAVALARSRRSVLVVDAGEPRNTPAAHAHNYLGREGVVPTRLLADGRDELAGYGGRVVAGRVVAAERVGDGGFRVGLDDGRTALARRLLVTTGLVDELPDVPGLVERWGRDVLHCPYCHGYEVRDQAIGVLMTGPMGVHQAQLFRQLSPTVTLFTHTGPGLSDEQREELSARGIAAVEGEVDAVEVQGDRLTGVRLRSGEVVALQALVVAPFFRARADLLAGLGLETTQVRTGETVIATQIAADPSGATAVPGVWVAGNAANPTAQVLSSAAAGMMAGAAINADLVGEETRAAVAAHHAGGSHVAAPSDRPDHQHPEVDPAQWFTQDFWDERYSGEPVWSGDPNPWLVHHAADLAPGTALDVGSGEGADVLWLAARGWRATGADISPVVLARSAQLAEQAGPEVVARTTWQQADLLTWEPPAGAYDLVSAQFVHLPPVEREDLHRRLAAAVRPGGTLLVVGHHLDDQQAGHRPFPADLFATAEEMAGVLDPTEWTISTSAPERDTAGHGDGPVRVRDAVLVAVRCG